MGSQDESFIDSLLDALKAGNIFFRIVMFLVFGLITATPYLVYNFDQVPAKVAASGASGGWMVYEFFKALTGSTLKGMAIGLSTFADALFHAKTVIVEKQVGTIIFSLIIYGFAIASLFQPIRLFFNIIDMQEKRRHSRALIIAVSAAIVLVVAAPLCWLFTGGETITSGIEKPDVGGEEGSTLNESISTNSSDNSSITKSLNMLTGG